MILWVALFLLVVAISFVLALRSMRDYQHIPQHTKEEYGLFLIRQPGNFNAAVLESLGKLMQTDSLIVSLERLFKGNQSALTIFGPRRILDSFMESLNLLELEDYTQGCDSQTVSVWEMGKKKNSQQDSDQNVIFENIAQLGQADQFFWQMVLGVKKIKDDVVFQTQIRAALFCQDEVQRKALVPLFESLQGGNLIKIPRPFSPDQMLNFFKLRSLSKDSGGPILKSEEVISLLRV